MGNRGRSSSIHNCISRIYGFLLVIIVKGNNEIVLCSV